MVSVDMVVVVMVLEAMELDMVLVHSVDLIAVDSNNHMDMGLEDMVLVLDMVVDMLLGMGQVMVYQLDMVMEVMVRFENSQTGYF